MPSTSTLAAFAAAAFVLIAVPGPNMIYLVARSLSEGRRAGLLSALGIETGTLVHTTAAAVGLSALLASSATAFAVVKYAGAAYLVYLGLRTLLARDGGSERTAAALAAGTLVPTAPRATAGRPTVGPLGDGRRLPRAGRVRRAQPGSSLHPLTGRL